jgi:hypothetical protein
MNITEEEHARWHAEHGEMTPEKHRKLMEKMGISEEEDRRWHAEHGSPGPAEMDSRGESVNPFAVGGGFLDYCVRQGWLNREGKGRTARYTATATGREELAKYGITV